MMKAARSHPQSWDFPGKGRGAGGRALQVQQSLTGCGGQVRSLSIAGTGTQFKQVEGQMENYWLISLKSPGSVMAS